MQEDREWADMVRAFVVIATLTVIWHLHLIVDLLETIAAGL